MSTALWNFWEVLKKWNNSWGCTKPLFTSLLKGSVPQIIWLLFIILLRSAWISFSVGSTFCCIVKRWSPQQDGFLVFLYLVGWLCAFFLLCILTTHLCVLLCFSLSSLVLALSAHCWTIFCSLFAMLHSFNEECSGSEFGPQIHTEHRCQKYIFIMVL